MRHWWQLGTRNWRVKPGRSLAVTAAAALGVGIVVAVTSIYASVEAAIGGQIVDNWVGRSHISIASPSGHWGRVDGGLADAVRGVAGVDQVAVRFACHMSLVAPGGTKRLSGDVYTGSNGRIDIDVVGIDPAVEYVFRRYGPLEGRLLQAGDRDAAVLDKKLAADLGLGVGDRVTVEAFYDEPGREVEVVGLIESRRVALFQRPVVQMPLGEVQDLRHEAGKVSIIDCLVRQADPETIEAAADRVRALIQERGEGYEVTTATVKLKQLRNAQQATRLILLLFAFVALLTSFFIILTTQSMGMMERVRVLGAMRCLGLTRGQLAKLVLAEVLPLGGAGVLLGWPVGLSLVRLATACVPKMEALIPHVTTSWWGLSVAMIGGLATVLAAAAGLLGQAGRVSPLQAARPEAKGGRRSVVVGAAVLGVALLAVHQLMIGRVAPLQWVRPGVAFAGLISLYGGYVLTAPALVLLVGGGAVVVAAPLLGIRRKLVQEQVGRAPWRAAGVCWMLMVGLSLIVYFAVRGESITHAWDFPKQLAGAFVWTPQTFPVDSIERVRKLPGVSYATPIREVFCTVKPRQASVLTLFRSMSMFVAGDPETFLAVAKIDFLQGDADDARRKLEQGGYVLLPQEASQSFGYNLGDKVPVTVAGRTVEFEVAGVVRSPAMDIAVTYFQADSYMMLASASSVLGTIGDLQRCFGIDQVTMFLVNVDPAPTEPPADFAADKPPDAALRAIAQRLPEWLPRLPEEQAVMRGVMAEIEPLAAGRTRVVKAEPKRQLRRYAQTIGALTGRWEELSPQARWDLFREQLVLEQVRLEIDRPAAMIGSLRRLKQDLDRDVRRATLIVSAVPAVSLLVASLGVANLMMVNVNSRARQIAMLRAVGATKSQIARLVLTEALVLGLLGSVVGVLLGLHSAHSTNVLTSRLFGFDIPWVVPWSRVIGGMALTWSVCLLAGIGPAMRAARSNVIDALRVG